MEETTINLEDVKMDLNVRQTKTFLQAMSKSVFAKMKKVNAILDETLIKAQLSVVYVFHRM